jgi:hypothetical protein
MTSELKNNTSHEYVKGDIGPYGLGIYFIRTTRLVRVPVSFISNVVFLIYLNSVADLRKACARKLCH